MNKKNNQIFTTVALVIGALLVFAVLYRPLFFILMMLATTLIVLGSIFYLVYYLSNLRHKDKLMQTVDEGIARQLETCDVQIDKNRLEIKDIQQNILDLESSMDKNMELIHDYRQKSKKILAGFYKEMDLRQTKIDFYKICKTKLETAQYNQNFSKKLTQKQQKLNELQEDHYEDLASMETFKSNLEYNKQFMESIETLSLRMLESNSLDSAQQLQLELKEITKELRRL